MNVHLHCPLPTCRSFDCAIRVMIINKDNFTVAVLAAQQRLIHEDNDRAVNAIGDTEQSEYFRRAIEKELTNYRVVCAILKVREGFVLCPMRSRYLCCICPVCGHCLASGWNKVKAHIERKHERRFALVGFFGIKNDNEIENVGQKCTEWQNFINKQL